MDRVKLTFRLLIADLNGSISQKWRRLRNCCASLRGVSTQSSPEVSRDTLLNDPSPCILVSTPVATSSLRLPGAKKSSVQDVLRAKLSRINVGLRKRRALSVQEFFHSPTHDPQQPTFYVPSPVSPELGGQGQDNRRRSHRSRQRTANSVNLSNSCQDYGYDSCGSQGYESLPYEPPPDYDLDDANTTNSTTTRRWSVVGSILHRNNNKPNNFVKLENLNIKIPKTKLNNRKNFERARSHSPNKHKDQAIIIKNEATTKCLHNSKVATSKSHYELMTGKQRPEVGQNKCERMSDHKQVCNLLRTI